ncbi:aminotransferase class III-fold pyridoxal phosphate-dependent enzyme [Micromonospora sp. R77]|uniref:aminotransferase class III-fold pyridoxal phosphate-dependent enzyme n=1 Tax=Micromonospora sp. R77 TaxID=2925836 RepID=UPI001F6240F7|nr:aminotransferase class III-fold pyridoxal phosphate-dependent enzyme [Micromonospora sp. R77]MCI4066896.1 aminotransferase class III-fold pyridoxal phosphate-dependent enzyme [Micromonospora sp. R77]
MSAPLHQGTTARAAEIGPETRQILTDLVREKYPIFVMPSWFVSTEAAQVGHLLSAAVGELTHGDPTRRHRAFFANSLLEALHGAVKLFRHRALDQVDRHGGRVAVLDPDPALGRRLDPLGAGPDRALVPGVPVVATAPELARLLAEGEHCGVILRDDTLDPVHAGRLADECRRRGIPIALDLGTFDFTRPRSPLAEAVRPDLVLVGGSVTDHEVPFGAFVGRPDLFAPWSGRTAFVHSNTYGGNSLAMRKVRAVLHRRWPDGSPVRRAADDIARDRERTLDAYAAHLNPATVELHRRTHGALHVVRAAGSRLTVQLGSGRRVEVLDGLCGAGLGVHGHNPDDLVTDVLERHDDEVDYPARLEEVLAAETGLARCFPAVSGASAVENAVTLAVLARPRNPRIVVFRHNYGGKTLVSLLATAAEGTRAPFGPLYPDVRYLDPFGPDAVTELRAELATGEVGLVWIEIVHGSSDAYGPIPDELLAVVARERAARGFLVGVDEVLTSFHRSGPRFAFQGRLPQVDLVALSKALSYGCFPTGATLVSEAVHQQARRTAPELVDDLRTRHLHRFAAHLALHAVAQVDRLDLPARTAASAATVAAGVAAMRHRSGSVGRRFVTGLMGRFEVLPPRLLRRFLRSDGDALTTVTMMWWILHARVFVVYDLFLLPLTASPAEARYFADRAVELSRTSPYTMLWQVGLLLLRDRLAGRRGRTRRAVEHLPLGARDE